MIFKRFHFTERKPELCNICEKKLLKSNFFSKKKKFKTLFLNICTSIGYFFLLHNNLIHKVWVDLINAEAATEGVLKKRCS